MTEETKETLRGLAPNLTGVMERHRAEIPKARRTEKLWLSLVGVALCLLAYLGRSWEWPAYGWGTAGFFGANLIAGDYRRLLFRSFGAIIADTVELLKKLADLGKQLWETIRSLTGKAGG